MVDQSTGGHGLQRRGAPAPAWSAGTRRVARVAGRALVAAWLVTAAAGCAGVAGSGGAGGERLGLRPAAGPELSARLRLPARDGRVPAVALLHGCDGVGAREEAWAGALVAAGYATAVVDSFGGRGLRETCSDGRALRATARIADAYAALEALARHPRIDPARIVLMGLSHGGTAAVRSATAWASETYGRPDGPAFRGVIALSPYCNTWFPEIARVPTPVFLHVGALDDWAPAKPCADLAPRWKRAGYDADVTVYPGAHHAFDTPGLASTARPGVDNAAACRFDLVSIASPPPDETERATCVRKGATVAGDAAAMAEARRRVLGQLAELSR